MIYINEDTLFYPAHQGDIDLDPEAPWAEVEKVEPPTAEFDEEPYQLEPKKIDGKWQQQWAIRKLNARQLEIKQGIGISPKPVLD